MAFSIPAGVSAVLGVGLPGMGKTTSLINLCNQLHRQAVTPIVFSFHQDIDEKQYDLVSAVAGRTRQDGDEKLTKFDEMMKYVDKVDSADLTEDEILNPTGWVLLGLILSSGKVHTDAQPPTVA